MDISTVKVAPEIALHEKVNDALVVVPFAGVFSVTASRSGVD